MTKISHITGALCRHPTRLCLLAILALVVYIATLNGDLSSYYEQTKGSIGKRQAETYIVTNQTTTSNSSVENSHKQALTPLRKRGTPKNRFVYVKIEKTGSSTFSNIFSSFGYRHRLNMMMSTIPESLVNTRELEPGSSWEVGPNRSDPHVMEQHARYNHKFYTKNFPPDTMYITSLRHPVKWFISFVDFMSTYRHSDPRDVLHNKRLFYKKRHFVTGMQRQVHNTFLQWLGFDVYKSSNLQAVKDYIDFVDQRFKLVMFTEHFDESLVLLRRTMNWSMADIFYTYANEATHRSNTVFTDEEKAKLIDKKHNLGDWMLYNHFNRTFWQKVEQEPEFFEEVDAFRVMNKKVQKFCFSKDLKKDKHIRLELKTKWEERFEFGERDCLAIRVIEGAAEEFAEALDRYIPTRGSKRVHDLNPSFMLPT